MKKPLIYIAATVFLSIVLGVISRLSVGFSDWYSVNVYRLAVNIFARISGIFPFSVAEILIIYLVPASIAAIVIIIIKGVKTKDKKRRALFGLKVFMGTLCTASTLLLLFIMNCGINYNRREFLHGENVDISHIGDEELWVIFNIVLDEFNAVLPLIHTDENGAFVLTGDLSKSAPEAMRAAAKLYPSLDTYYPRPKPVINSEIMSHFTILGVYSPYTIEANYNNAALDSEKPLTACHELAHLTGFMREDEANFIAFIACRESGDPELMYSAYLNIIFRLANAFDSIDYYLAAHDLIPEQAHRQREMQYDYWWKYFYRIIETVDEDTGEVIEIIKSAPASDISEEVNDAYLKSQGMGDGVKSYGRVLDLIIAFYME
ncbi:MAG: DUF3810 domain-containing protein [Oscillospiraceae bacterium]|nr:DUF3810 domain-containing protein [Oscillospiraceae bacterium]